VSPTTVDGSDMNARIARESASGAKTMSASTPQT
jgi:hypothetical protein